MVRIRRALRLRSGVVGFLGPLEIHVWSFLRGEDTKTLDLGLYKDLI